MHLPGSWLDLSSLLPQNDTTYVTYSGMEGMLLAVWAKQFVGGLSEDEARHRACEHCSRGRSHTS